MASHPPSVICLWKWAFSKGRGVWRFKTTQEVWQFEENRQGLSHSNCRLTPAPHPTNLPLASHTKRLVEACHDFSLSALLFCSAYNTATFSPLCLGSSIQKIELFIHYSSWHTMIAGTSKVLHLLFISMHHLRLSSHFSYSSTFLVYLNVTLFNVTLKYVFLCVHMFNLHKWYCVVDLIVFLFKFSTVSKLRPHR